ncbi:hypothetical protein Tco_0314956, partial [Tanacetum coccineum]
VEQIFSQTKAAVAAVED